ncbi:uncharacterized protein LOC130785936 isoform X2 [Actinidia eriantha]|uniref:uncharacterized protein LOC130785936 isoform X2 n=1 Tax=Actinidia eriantha TaxID=165200 RepID=UPI002587822D|nr:uncharacterized protein LOC130785936 isoform X2 [Actinidia eriantha]
MINSEVNCNVLGNSGTGMPPDYKYSPLVKKIALRDVQNDNRSLIHSHPECSPDLDRHIICTIKVSGTKRLTPECPISPPLDPSLRKNDVNDHLIHTRRKFELEPDKGRMQDSLDKLAYWPLSSSKHYFHKQEELTRQQSQMRESNLYCAPEVRRNHMASMMAFPYGGPGVSNSIGKHGNGQPAADSKATDDQLRKERYLHLQKFLKQCDEFIQRDYIEVLVNVSPAELSRHAIELEKRAIQLTVEEGKQMQRMKALNILGRSDSTNDRSLRNEN